MAKLTFHIYQNAATRCLMAMTIAVAVIVVILIMVVTVAATKRGSQQ